MENKAILITNLELALPAKTSETPAPKRKRDLPVHERPDFWLMILAGCLMAFQAGFINVISILKVNITISHITGNSSKLGISIASVEIQGIFLGCGLLLSFLAGCTLIGFFIRKQIFVFNRKYGIFLIVEAVVLYFFKCAFDAEKNQLAVFFGSFACGIQNALLTNLSGAVVRTTHVTGMMTDTGLVLGNYIRRGAECKEVWKLRVFVSIMLSYIFGATMSKFFYNFFDYKAILFSVFFLGLFGFLILLWRLLKKYNGAKFKMLKEKLIYGINTSQDQNQETEGKNHMINDHNNHNHHNHKNKKNSQNKILHIK